MTQKRGVMCFLS